MIPATIAADVLRPTFAAVPLYVLALALGAGVAITTIFYVSKSLVKKADAGARIGD
jgi:hypothetical protein